MGDEQQRRELLGERAARAAEEEEEAQTIVAGAIVERYATNLCLAGEVWLLTCAVLTLPVVLLDFAVDGLEAWGPVQRRAEERGPWCEAIDADRFVRTPITSYSALAFAYFGVLIPVLVYLFDAAPARNHFRVFAPFNWLYCFAMLFAGVGSLLYHASAVKGWPDMIDRVSTWPLVVAPTVFLAMRLVRVPTQEHWYWIALFATVAVSVGLAIPHLVETHRGPSEGTTAFFDWGVPAFAVLFVVLIVARLIGQTCGTHPMSTTGPAALVLAGTLAVLAFALRRPEQLGVCDPHGAWFLNTHMHWHVLIAASVFLLWAWCYFEDVADDAYLERARRVRDARRPRLRLLPDLGRLLLNQPSRAA